MCFPISGELRPFETYVVARRVAPLCLPCERFLRIPRMLDDRRKLAIDVITRLDPWLAWETSGSSRAEFNWEYI